MMRFLLRARFWLSFFYWLRSRYAPKNAFVRCATCPHWLVHSKVDARLPAAKLPKASPPMLALKYVAGVCLRDKPRIFNDFTTGYALRVWTGEDWCARHPLYDGAIVQGSDLDYRPGEKATEGAGGFSRLPTFAEAVKMALTKQDAQQDAQQEKEQDRGT